jgi:hypothetical protein
LKDSGEERGHRNEGSENSVPISFSIWLQNKKTSEFAGLLSEVLSGFEPL